MIHLTFFRKPWTHGRMMKTPWTLWKKSFGAWDGVTSRYLQRWLESPIVLEPTGLWLSTMMRAKALGDKATAAWWSAMGLPTKRDQERTLHALNQLQSQILDLEERIADARA
jgi:hypothetical protein